VSDDRDDEREAERLARAAERLAHEADREAERVARQRERDAELLARESERAAERAGRDAERMAHEAKKEAERVARQRERDAELLAREAEQEAERVGREAEQIAREAEKEAEQVGRDVEREAERVAREVKREAREVKREARKVKHEARGRGAGPGAGTGAGAGAGPGASSAAGVGADAGAGSGSGAEADDCGDEIDHDMERFARRWERIQAEQRERLERLRTFSAEHRNRWHERSARHRARWERHQRRWAALHEEREMWLRMGEGKRPWGPWWLQARMRRRIFSWLGLSFASGAVVMHLWPEPRWWHAVLALLCLSMMSGAIAFRLTRPLLRIARVAQDIGDGKLDARLDVRSHRGETRLLAVAINEMAERIQQQVLDQRQLLAAVSHELRTPLGHMRVLIDTARTGTDRADRAALAELEREVLMLDDLVGRLLASSRLEFGNLDCRATDLGELVSDVATACGIAPEAIEAIGDVRATVDPTLVRRAVANLLDNARVHGQGAVAVRIERRARQVAIEVDDAGPGVPADRRADAFRAFVPSHGGGLGLGLALVSRIAVAHNGGAWIGDRPGGGARVGFTVEVAPRPAEPA
jgi:signal transduction histidine kinase